MTRQPSPPMVRGSGAAVSYRLRRAGRRRPRARDAVIVQVQLVRWLTAGAFSIRRSVQRWMGLVELTTAVPFMQQGMCGSDCPGLDAVGDRDRFQLSIWSDGVQFGCATKLSKG